jgi:heptosyltransferase-1
LEFAQPFRLKRLAPEPALKVLIVRVGAMGDVLHALPAAAALREKLPDCVIGWAVEPRWVPLLAGGEGRAIVDRLHLVPTREWKRRPVSVATLQQILALRREMREAEYDVCVDLQGSIRSAVIGRMADVDPYLGPAEPRERQARRLYRERVEVKSAHVIDQACELLGTALTDSADPRAWLRPARVTLPVIAEAEAWCDRWLAGLGVAAKGFVLLSPTAGWGAKQWPLERYRVLAARLAAEGFSVLVNAGSNADLAVAAAVAADGNAQPVQCGVAELVALTRRARLVVGGDSGPIHLAAALGRPVVALFGPTDPKRNGPYFPASRVRVLRHETSRLDHARHAMTEAGLAKITEDEVTGAALALLRELLREVRQDG